jgi:hypothetical protein
LGWDGRTWFPSDDGIEDDREEQEEEDRGECLGCGLDRLDREESEHDRDHGDRERDDQRVAAGVDPPAPAGDADEQENGSATPGERNPLDYHPGPDSPPATAGRASALVCCLNARRLTSAAA